MCGIVAYLGTRSPPLEAATDIIEYRGPDAEGFLEFSVDSGRILRGRSQRFPDGTPRVSLGFRRLAIIDLDSRSNQPFSDADDRYHIIFNGEIYNYLEIRTELEGLGHQFRTRSDTEVLLTAYKQWGAECCNRFNGMWAFAILDVPQRTLFCARDRFGIKPFYYHVSADGELFIASEIKQFFTIGVRKELNTALLRDFLDKRILDHTTDSFFRGIHCLPGGHMLTTKLDEPGESIRIGRFWRLECRSPYEDLNFEEAAERFRELFTDSIRLRFRSDVPVGACLSGGLDSSAVVAVAASIFDQPIHTFTSQFEIAEFDETEYAKLLPEKYPQLIPHYCQPKADGFIEEFDRMLFHLDEPFPTMSNFARWEVMRLVRQQGVTVVLNGQGADELLAGYRKFYAFYLKELLGRGRLLRFLKELGYLVYNRDFQFFDFKEIRRYVTSDSGQGTLLNKEGQGLPSSADIGLDRHARLSDRCIADVEKYSYPVLLRYEDRLSMAFSLETRVPFMDYRLVEFILSLPSEYKIRNGFTKAVLRKALQPVLPSNIHRRTSKLGFATPESVWQASSLREHFADVFRHADTPWIDRERIIAEFDRYPRHTHFSSYSFFSVYCFIRWHQTNFG